MCTRGVLSENTRSKVKTFIYVQVIFELKSSGKYDIRKKIPIARPVFLFALFRKTQFDEIS